MISGTTAGYILIAALVAAAFWTGWLILRPLPGTTSERAHGPAQKRHGCYLTPAELAEWESLAERARMDEWERLYTLVTDEYPVVRP